MFEIGRELRWIDIVAQVFHVLNFDKSGTTIKPDGKLKTKGFFKPYGYLIVESPILNMPVKLPIVHRDDFLLASSVFDEPILLEVIKEKDLLVTYVPEKITEDGRMASPSHALHYVIVPKGTLDLYYNFENDLHMSQPAPEKIFGEFVWHGEIRVRINDNPQF